MASATALAIDAVDSKASVIDAASGKTIDMMARYGLKAMVTLNGEKIYVTSGERSDAVVVWATLDRSLGRAAIKSFVVERSNPGLKLDRLDLRAHP